MFLSDQKLNDPNYENLKMLSFAYQPGISEALVSPVYGVIVDFVIDPFSTERKFLACYNSGFSAFYSTQNGGNINGHIFKPTEDIESQSFELFIASTSKRFPDNAIAEKSIQLIAEAADFLSHTQENVNFTDQQNVQLWFLTSSGAFSATADIFEIQDKSSVWTGFFQNAFAIYTELESAISSNQIKAALRTNW